MQLTPALLFTCLALRPTTIDNACGEIVHALPLHNKADYAIPQAAPNITHVQRLDGGLGKKMSEHGEIYTADKNFTLPPAVTALTNSTSVGSY